MLFPRLDKFEITQMMGDEPTAENVVGYGWKDMGEVRMYFSHEHQTGPNSIGIVGSFLLLRNLHLPMHPSRLVPDKEGMLPTLWAGKLLMRPAEQYTINDQHYGLYGMELGWAVRVGNCFHPNTYPISYGIRDLRSAEARLDKNGE